MARKYRRIGVGSAASGEIDDQIKLTPGSAAFKRRLKKLALKLRDKYGFADVEIDNIIETFETFRIVEGAEFVRGCEKRRKQVLALSVDLNISWDEAREEWYEQIEKKVRNAWDVIKGSKDD